MEGGKSPSWPTDDSHEDFMFCLCSLSFIFLTQSLIPQTAPYFFRGRNSKFWIPELCILSPFTGMQKFRPIGKTCKKLIWFLPRCIYATRSFAAKVSLRLSVSLSVCLSVTRVNCDKTKESSAEILIPYESYIMQFFGHVEWLVGDAPFYLKFWVKLTHPASKTVIFTRYSLVALDLAKKVQL